MNDLSVAGSKSHAVPSRERFQGHRIDPELIVCRASFFCSKQSQLRGLARLTKLDRPEQSVTYGTPSLLCDFRRPIAPSDARPPRAERLVLLQARCRWDPSARRFALGPPAAVSTETRPSWPRVQRWHCAKRVAHFPPRPPWMGHDAEAPAEYGSPLYRRPQAQCSPIPQSKLVPLARSLRERRVAWPG